MGFKQTLFGKKEFEFENGWKKQMPWRHILLDFGAGWTSLGNIWMLCGLFAATAA